MYPKHLNYRFCAATALCAAVLLASSPSANAGSTIRDGLGAITIGRGATNIAFADNGQVMLDNPAGLANIPGNGLVELGLDVLGTRLTYQDPKNPLGVNDIDNPFPAGQLSFAKRLNDRWTAGFGVFSHAGFASEYIREGPAPFSGPQHQKSLGMLVRFLPAIAYKATDRLSVGGTLGVALSHLEFEGPYTFNGPDFPGIPSRVDVLGTGAALSWSVGMQYDLTERTRVGVSYQGQTDFDLHGTTKADIFLAGRGYYDSVMKASWPSSLGVGIKHRLTCCQTFAFDVLWLGWENSWDSFDLTLNNGVGPVAGLTGPSLQESFPLNWSDVVEFRFGYQVDFGCHGKFRTGYIYHDNPIPESTLTNYIQTTYKHTYSFGFGRRIKNHNVDIGYSLAWGDRERIGTSALAGGDFDNAALTTTVHWFGISFQRL